MGVKTKMLIVMHAIYFEDSILIYTPIQANKQNVAMTSAQSTKQFNDGFYDENWE